MSEYYDFLDKQINHLLRADVGFNNLLSTELYRFEPQTMKGFFDRYTLIKQFQEITSSLFNASLKGESDPEIAKLVINELPEHQGYDYHRNLDLKPHQTPVFFRTDEVIPGKISEIQCPGSLWGIYEQLYQFHLNYAAQFGKSESFPKGLAENFADALKTYLGKSPLIHHLTDNASLPHDNRFFLQCTRNFGLNYFGYDKDIMPQNCNFIRGHAFSGLLSDNFALQRLFDYKAQYIHYDLTPSILFDEKISLMFPFWHKTRNFYTDNIRNIFPYTQLITPEGFELEDGTHISIEKFCKLSQKQRNYYIKYAGCDLSLNWGSRGVYFAGSFSGIKCRELFQSITDDYASHRYWIIQQGYLTDDTVHYMMRNNESLSAKVHSKYSGFYGSSGLMGILVMQRPFYKVHGSTDTIVRICK